jgi:hypothetical protein
MQGWRRWMERLLIRVDPGFERPQLLVQFSSPLILSPPQVFLTFVLLITRHPLAFGPREYDLTWPVN